MSFQVNNWRLVWEATKVEKQQAQAVQELTGKLRHGGMAAWLTFERFEQSRMSRTTVAEWSEWQTSRGRWTKTPTNSSTAQRPPQKLGASLALVFGDFASWYPFFHILGINGGIQKDQQMCCLSVIRSAVAGWSLCEKAWQSSSICFNTLDKSCALVHHLSFVISSYSSWPQPQGERSREVFNCSPCKGILDCLHFLSATFGDFTEGSWHL